MKRLIMLVAIVALGSFLTYRAMGETANPASNVTADTEATAGTVVLRHSSTGASSLGGLTLTGGIGFYSRTIAQLLAITPSAVGQAYYCSDCSPKKAVISTGTSVGNFAAIDGGNFL